MSSIRVAAVVFCIGLVVIARAAWDNGRAGATSMRLEEIGMGSPGPLGGSRPTTEMWIPPRETKLLDLYGNEVERAIGDYRVDERGEMFELHSPETALPSLPRPEA